MVEVRSQEKRGRRRKTSNAENRANLKTSNAAIFSVGSGRRYYNPELGRWVNRDPIGERGGLNLCGFINNNTIGAVDVLGRAAFVVMADSLPLEEYVSLFRTLNQAHGKHTSALVSAFQSLCSRAEYSSSSGTKITQDVCRLQAKNLADVVSDAVREKLRSFVLELGHLPMGYDIGIIGSWIENVADLARGERESAVQCGDWQAAMVEAVNSFIAAQGKCSAFGYKNVSGRKKFPSRTHQWVEVWGPDKGVVLDPWSTGGREIIGQTSDWTVTSSQGFFMPQK